MHMHTVSQPLWKPIDSPQLSPVWEGQLERNWNWNRFRFVDNMKKSQLNGINKAQNLENVESKHFIKKYEDC